MISHGDELGRTQFGNNNVYCQDNPISWVDWELGPDQKEMLEFSQQLVRLRREHPVFRRRRFFAGRPDHGGESELGEIEWFTPSGDHMDDDDWRTGYAKTIAVFLNGSAIPEPNPRGEPTVDDSFLLIINGHHESITFTLPDADHGARWLPVLDTTSGFADRRGGQALPPSTHLPVAARSVVVLQCPMVDEAP